jgi:integrase
MEWANNRNESGLSIRTLSDRARYWKFLSPVYGEILVNAILPEHLLPYFHKRTSKASAKKELKFLSVIFNWARSRGYMKVPNPCAGLFVQMKVKERRDIYVEDSWLALVYKHADDIIKDCLDLAYLTGQRPADVRKMRWDQIKDGALEIKQNKTKAKLRLAIEGDLADLIKRIKTRQGIKGFTILADPKGQPLKEFGYFRSHFDKARDAAEQEAKELGISFERFQFRDLRPKAASDIDAMHDIKAAQKLLGHTTEQMTAAYIRSRRGDVVQPMSKKPKSG